MPSAFFAIGCGTRSAGSGAFGEDDPLGVGTTRSGSAGLFGDAAPGTSAADPLGGATTRSAEVMGTQSSQTSRNQLRDELHEYKDLISMPC